MEQFDKGTGITDIAQTLADRITADVAHHYPLKATVIGLTEGENLIVDIGSKQGLQPGMRMDVYTGATDRKGMTIRGKRVGRVEISSVEQNQALARALESSGKLEKGLLLVEVTGAS